MFEHFLQLTGKTNHKTQLLRPDKFKFYLKFFRVGFLLFGIIWFIESRPWYT